MVWNRYLFGTGLNVATKQGDWIGGWNLGGVDKLIVDKEVPDVNIYLFQIATGLVIYGLVLRVYIKKAMYYSYIHAFKHHDYGWY